MRGLGIIVVVVVLFRCSAPTAAAPAKRHPPGVQDLLVGQTVVVVTEQEKVIGALLAADTRGLKIWVRGGGVRWIPRRAVRSAWSLRPPPRVASAHSGRELAWKAKLEADGQRLVGAGITAAALGLAGTLAGIIVMFAGQRPCSRDRMFCNLGNFITGFGVTVGSAIVGAVISIPLLIVGRARVLRARAARAAEATVLPSVPPTDPPRRRAVVLRGGASIALVSWSGRF